MAMIPGITSPILPSIFAGEVFLKHDLSDLEELKLSICVLNNSVVLSVPGAYAIVDFSNGTYSSTAMRKLIQLYPAEKTKLLLMALRQGMKDVWREQDAATMTQIMAEVLGAK